MQLQELTYLLQHPEAVTASQVDALSTQIKAYPYFQPLRALYLKGLKQKESYKYNNALKITAAHTADRSVLFDYITSDIFNQNEISEQIKHNSEHIKSIEVNAVDDISIHKSVFIDDALKEQIKATEGVLDPDLFKAKPIPRPRIEDSKIEDSIISVDVKNITTEKKLKIGEPLEFNKSENHSFTEWLKITSFKPIVRIETEAEVEPEKAIPESRQETAETKVSKPLDNKRAIIDKFLSDNPKIKPVSGNAPKPKLVNNDADVSESLMTETLFRTKKLR